MFRRATACSSTGCVEVDTEFRKGTVAVRDSKNPDGPQLHFTTTEWATFIDGVKAGEFNSVGVNT